MVAEMPAPSILKMVKEYFGMNLAQMKAEWTPLSPADKADIEKGLRDGTETY